VIKILNKENKKQLKTLLDFIIISKKLLEKKDLDKGYYDLDIIYHLKSILNNYFWLKDYEQKTKTEN